MMVSWCGVWNLTKLQKLVNVRQSRLDAVRTQMSDTLSLQKETVRVFYKEYGTTPTRA